MYVDVFHDTVCPWCRIGKRRLSDALARWDGPPVAVRYHPFFLDDTVPPEGVDFRAYMARNKGGEANLAPLFEGARRAGAAAGLTFHFDKIRYATNTLLSHRLIALAPDDRKEAVVDGIYRAYFEEGRDIGDLDTLVAIASEAGLDAAATAELLRGDAARDEVLAEAAWAREAGIGGVPPFIVDGALALSGAQPSEALLAALRRAAALRREAPAAGRAG